MHAVGGIKRPRGARLAIPVSGNILGVKPTALGIPKGLRAAAIKSSTPKRALRIANIKRSGNQGLFVGRGGRLNLIYTMPPQAQIRPTVPFYSDFNDLIRREARLPLPGCDEAGNGDEAVKRVSATPLTYRSI
jgi:hypothetical protein